MPSPACDDAASFLGLVARHRGTCLGRVVDVLLGDDERVIGLELEAAGSYRIFLPASTWEYAEDRIEVPLPLSVLSELELGFYEQSTRRLTELLSAGAVCR